MTPLLLVLLAACGPGLPRQFADCPDLECQQRWVSERWETDPEAVTLAIGAIPDVVTRIALVRQLTVAHPGEAIALCDLLSGTQEQQACLNRNRRPHLQDVKLTGSGNAATEEEEDDHGLQLTRPIPSPWADVQPDTVPCTVEARVCQTEEAQRRAAAGELERAAAACAALTEPTWKAECFFQAAESGAHNQSLVAGQAVGLCLGASSYAGRCLSHIVRQLGTFAPRASGAEKGRWPLLTEIITLGRAQLEAGDPTLAVAFEHQAWAYALRFAYVRDFTVTAVPLDHVPANAAPHVRAALAWRLWSLEGMQDRSLAEWQARLSAVLADRSPKAPREATGPSRAQNHLRRLWTRVLPGEEKIPSVPYLGPNNRALHADPELDALICLLEAAAQGRPPGGSLLEQALGHPDATVRWTAARLLSAVNPRSPALRKHTDTDPLVSARLSSTAP